MIFTAAPRPSRASTPEPPPKPTGGRPVWELVIEDMLEREREGRRKYGAPLQAGNGRDPLVDAYQEALDLAVYLRQAIEKRAKLPRPTCATVGVETGSIGIEADTRYTWWEDADGNALLLTPKGNDFEIYDEGGYGPVVLPGVLAPPPPHTEAP